MGQATFRLRKEREAAKKAVSKPKNKKATKAARAKSSKKVVDSNGSDKLKN